MVQEMIIKPIKYNSNRVLSSNHSIEPISYTAPVVRQYVLLYTAARTIILKWLLFTRNTITNNLNHLVKHKMSERNIIIKRLDTPELIEDACALLCTAHFEYGDWEFSPNNPSQIRIEIRNNRKVLIDRFTDNAIWFGAFDESKIIGCTRLTFPDENNKLEIEGYKNSSVIQKYLPRDKSHCVESTRSRVLKSYSGLGVIWQLLLAAFQYCEDNRYSLCATTNNEPMIAILKKLGFPLKLASAFKYEEHDPSPVNFYFADYSKSEIKNIILNLEIHKNTTTRNIPKIFDALNIVAPILPTIVYWHDTKGAVLGLNSHCLDGMGKTREAVIGKTPHDFYPKEIACPSGESGKIIKK
jgi:RimJ/RimL family protein N-acetyltransferase